VKQDRGDTAEQPALLHRLQVGEQLLLGDSEYVRRRSVWLGDHRHVALRRADHRDVELVVGLALGLGRRRDLDGLGQRVGATLHLEIHPDLEQLERRQLADRLGAGNVREHLERPL
jgi:hypothetical protein